MESGSSGRSRGHGSQVGEVFRSRRKRRPVRRDATLPLGQPESLERRQLMAVVAGSDESTRAAASRLVVIDASLAGHPGIATSFGADATILYQSSSDDLFANVRDALAAEASVSSIHLVGHGAPGSMTLGDVTFSADGVDDLAGGLVAWNRLAAPGADLLLWGCDVAGGDGASLVDLIREQSGFDVAASIDVTGPAALGGDFDLEYVVGDVTDAGIVAGVDMLWGTTLADHAFTNKSKQAMLDAFGALNDKVAPAIHAAFAAKVSSTRVDPLMQRPIDEMFTSATSISPADVESILTLKAVATTYLNGVNPTLSGLATAINTALAANVTTAAADGTRSISVTPMVVGNEVELRVALTEWHRRIPDYRIAPGATLDFTVGVRSLDAFPMILGESL